MKRIVYQGAQGSFSELAALAAFGSDVQLTGKETFLSLYEALEEDQADIAVIPIENTLIGSIWENYDLLHQFDIAIVGEKLLKIEHCLLGIEGSDHAIKKLKRVYSHPKALDQCRAFFRTHPWIEPIVHYDTAGAAAMLAQRQDPEEAAIASCQTAQLYSLCVLKKGIADNPHNYTRFLFAAKKERNALQGDKCTVLITLKHEPGALAEVLQDVAGHGINLTKIESRPIIGKPFEYLFYIDLQFGPTQMHLLEQALKNLQEITQSCKMLGIYNKDRSCVLNA
ncbi:MAG: ACT domain-containing protein [Verrucomicrobia bacterium]|nr:ACT domain-containing protein [Verrucomicrobiota bacterium]